MPTPVREQIGELYYRSETIKFGAFPLSVHIDNPDLPLSPWYLHYPEEGEPGTQYLPELFRLIGVEFKNMNDELGLQPVRIAGVPRGALLLGEELAKQYEQGYPGNLLVFGKEQTKPVDGQPGKTEFTGPTGTWEPGDELQIVEDHTSGGRNKRLILNAAQRAGLVVPTMLTVVDREQGGVANMAELNVALHSIFTASELLNYGVAEGHISQTLADEVNAYRETNPL